MIYKYGLKSRGVSIGCQPNGFIYFQDTDKSETGYYGFVFYARQLSNEELKKYELTLIEVR